MEPPTRFPKQLTPEIPDNGAVCAGGRAPAGRLVSAVNCISIQQMANQEISARISYERNYFFSTLCIRYSAERSVKPPPFF